MRGGAIVAPLLPTSAASAEDAEEGRPVLPRVSELRLRGGNDGVTLGGVCGGCCCSVILILLFCTASLTPNTYGLPRNYLTGEVDGDNIVRGGLHIMPPWKTYVQFPATRMTLEFSQHHEAETWPVMTRTGPDKELVVGTNGTLQGLEGVDARYNGQSTLLYCQHEDTNVAKAHIEGVNFQKLSDSQKDELEKAFKQLFAEAAEVKPSQVRLTLDEDNSEVEAMMLAEGPSCELKDNPSLVKQAKPSEHELARALKAVLGGSSSGLQMAIASPATVEAAEGEAPTMSVVSLAERAPKAEELENFCAELRGDIQDTTAAPSGAAPPSGVPTPAQVLPSTITTTAAPRATTTQDPFPGVSVSEPKLLQMDLWEVKVNADGTGLTETQLHDEKLEAGERLLMIKSDNFMPKKAAETGGGQPIKIACSLQYTFIKEKLKTVYLDFGGYENAVERYLLLAGNMVSNRAQDFTPDQFWKIRDTIAEDMRSETDQLLREDGAEVNNFQILKIDFDPIYEDAITAVQVAEQTITVNQNIMEVEKVVQDTKIMKAANEATIANIVSGAEAHRKMGIACAKRDVFDMKQEMKAEMYSNLKKDLSFDGPNMAEYFKIKSIVQTSEKGQVVVGLPQVGETGTDATKASLATTASLAIAASQVGAHSEGPEL